MIRNLMAFLMCVLLATPARAQESSLALPELDAAVEPESATAIPALLNYQARFTNDVGAPLPGPAKLRFAFYALPTGGGALWTETHDAVALTDGVAGVLLGSRTPLTDETLNRDALYLAVSINDAPDLTPRMRVTSVPYALDASRLQGKQAVDFEPKGAVLVLSLSDGSPPNEGTNRVHWDVLRGVPEDFADGIDTGVTDHGALTGLTDDDHPQYAREPDLAASSGSGPNTGKNLVHWENLVGVPSGFADGADNTAAGGGIVDHGDLVGLEDDDHPQYATDLDLTAHVGAADPHSGYSLDTDLAAHAADSSAHHTKTVDASELTTGTLDAGRLPAGGVGSAVIAPNAVNSSHVADGTLTGEDLAPGTVGPSDLANGAVTGIAVTDGSLTGADLATGSVPADRLEPGSVTALELATAAFDSTHLADGGVSGADLVPGSIDSLQLASAAVDSVHLAGGAVSRVHLTSGAVDSSALALAAVNSMHLASGAVTSEAVADESLTTTDLKNNSVTAADIQDEPGVEIGHGAGPYALGTTGISLFSHTILPPASGWVLALVTGTACIDGPGLGADVTLTISLSAQENTIEPTAQVQMKRFVPPGARDCVPFTVQALIPVIGGNTQTVYVSGKRLNGSTADLSGLSLSLVYLSTGY